MFEGFRTARVPVADGVEIFARFAGSGPAVLLLHGYPQTHACWHLVAPALVAAGFCVVASDLRGYGRSSKPASTADHAPYSKRSMASDQVALMAALGHGRFAVAGHDRGGRVAHRMALDHPQAVTRLAVLDIAPTAAMYAATDKHFATAYYHWFFLIQPAPLPERMIGADPEFYLRAKLGRWSRSDASAFDPAALADYLRAFSDPACIAATCADYRAGAGIDLHHDASDAGRRLTMPVLALWGAKGFVAEAFDVPACWRAVAHDVRGHAVPGGHFLPEEAPAETSAALTEFFRTG